jgi:hypothetical protein
MFTSVRESIGRAGGWLSAPVFAAIALARRARVFHPEGIVLSARVESIAVDARARRVAANLAGPAIVRFSTALWRKGREWPDALGCAIRLRDDETPGVVPGPGDQDLLFATIRTPSATALGPVGTHVHDFLANTYFATAPFDLSGVGRVKWRLVPERRSPPRGDRGRSLQAAVARGQAAMRLELRRTWRARYVAVARVVLLEVVELDQDALRFSPFRAGRGIVPRGLVHALRRGAYAASQQFGHERPDGHG